MWISPQQFVEGSTQMQTSRLRDTVGKYIVLRTLFDLPTHIIPQYHLQCVELGKEPQNWVCVACEASGRGRGGKRQRR